MEGLNDALRVPSKLPEGWRGSRRRGRALSACGDHVPGAGFLVCLPVMGDKHAVI
jgi:hypothetical protein